MHDLADLLKRQFLVIIKSDDQLLLFGQVINSIDQISTQLLPLDFAEDMSVGFGADRFDPRDLAVVLLAIDQLI
jgi:hypothetical protein